MRRWSADAGSDRSATATARCRRTSRTHSRWHRWRAWRWLWWLGGRELFAHRRSRCGGSHFVITPATTEIDQIRIVGILQNSQEIPLAEALTVAAEQVARDGAHVAGARWSALRNRATDEVKRIFTR